MLGGKKINLFNRFLVRRKQERFALERRKQLVFLGVQHPLIDNSPPGAVFQQCEAKTPRFDQRKPGSVIIETFVPVVERARQIRLYTFQSHVVANRKFFQSFEKATFDRRAYRAYARVPVTY